jgi:hypothetical protein
MLFLLSAATVIVVPLCGAVLLPDPADFYHLLPVVLPFLMLLAGAGAARLKWVGVPCVGAIMVLHLTLLWGVLSPTTASATNAAVGWIADHRAVRCVTLLRRPTDEAPGRPVYAFVRDVPIIDGGDGGDCPAVIAFPGQQAPPRRDGRWTVLRSVDGPVVIWEAP